MTTNGFCVAWCTYASIHVLSMCVFEVHHSMLLYYASVNCVQAPRQYFRNALYIHISLQSLHSVVNSNYSYIEVVGCIWLHKGASKATQDHCMELDS